MTPGLRKWLMSVLPLDERNGHADGLSDGDSDFPAVASPPPQNGARSQTYPFQYVRDVKIRGCDYVFRPIRHEDDDLMLLLFATFSEDTIYHRFFTILNMSRDKVKRFTHINYRSEMAIVAESINEDGAAILTGVARYATSRRRPGWGEMSLVVGDPWHKKGIGSALLRYLLEVARNEGLEGLSGYVHYDNIAVHKIFKKLGLKVDEFNNGSEVQYDVYLQPGPGKIDLQDS